MGCFRRAWSVFVERDLVRWVLVHAGLILEIGKKWPTCGLLAPLVDDGWPGIRLAPPGVETHLLGLPGFRIVVLLTPLVGALPAVMLAAAERAAQIPTPSVAGMRQKEDPAMLASSQAPSKVWLSLYSRPQQEVILQYKLPNRIIMIPSLAKFKTLPNLYGKFARFWLTIPICFCISSSYPIEANASTGGAGIFFLLGASVSGNWQYLPEVWIARAQKKATRKRKRRSPGS